MEELKPCPFCGGKVEMWEHNFGVVTVFQCEQCKARIVFPWNKPPGDWNRRTEKQCALSEMCRLYAEQEG